MADTDNFFVEISKGTNDSTLLVQTLFEFAKKINAMGAEDLIAFYQALKMLKGMQQKSWFRKNPILTNILNTQLMVIQAMIKTAQKENDPSLTNRFNAAIGDDWIRGMQHQIQTR